jgi:hypothetical protein
MVTRESIRANGQSQQQVLRDVITAVKSSGNHTQVLVYRWWTYIYPEDGKSWILKKISYLPHYKASHSRRQLSSADRNLSPDSNCLFNRFAWLFREWHLTVQTKLADGPIQPPYVSFPSPSTVTGSDACHLWHASVLWPTPTQKIVMGPCLLHFEKIQHCQ